MQIKIERSELLKHLRACKAIGCKSITIAGGKGHVKILCVTPSISTAIPCVCDDEEGRCNVDAAGAKALVGVLVSIADEKVTLDVEARTIAITADRVEHSVTTFPAPEGAGQGSLL